MLRRARGCDDQILKTRLEFVLVAIALAAALGWLQSRTPYLIGAESYAQGYRSQLLLGRRQCAPAAAELQRHQPQRLSQLITALALAGIADETRAVKVAAWAQGLAALLALWALLRALGVRAAWLYPALVLGAGERFVLELLVTAPDVLNLALLAALAAALLGRRRWPVVLTAALLGLNTSWAPALALGLWAVTRWARLREGQIGMALAAALPAALTTVGSGPDIAANAVGLVVQARATAEAWLLPLAHWTVQELHPVEGRALLLGPGAIWCVLLLALGVIVWRPPRPETRGPALAALGALALAALRVGLEFRGFVWLVPAVACFAALAIDGLETRARRWALALVALCALTGGAGTLSHVLPRLRGINAPGPYLEGTAWLQKHSERDSVVVAAGALEAEVLGFLSSHNRFVALGDPAALSAADPARALAWQRLRRGQEPRVAALCNDSFDADWLFVDKTRIELHRLKQVDSYLLLGWQADEFGIYRCARQKPK